MDNDIQKPTARITAGDISDLISSNQYTSDELETLGYAVIRIYPQSSSGSSYLTITLSGIGVDENVKTELKPKNGYSANISELITAVNLVLAEKDMYLARARPIENFLGFEFHGLEGTLYRPWNKQN
jgi:hypothetical protein